MPAIKAPIASDRPSSSASAAHATRNPNTSQEEELEWKPVEQTVERPAEPTRRCDTCGDEAERLRDEHERLRRTATACCREPEHEGDDDVLEHEDREDEVGLVVCQTPEVDEALHGDGAGRDVDARGEHERGGRRAEGDHADREAEPRIDREVRSAPEPEVPSGPREAVEAELEPEEEEEEDEPELGHELGHLGRTDQRELRGLVGPEQEPRQQVRRDRREPEAPRDQPERGEQRDGDGELGEGHGAILAARDRALRLRKAWSANAPESAREPSPRPRAGAGNHHR